MFSVPPPVVRPVSCLGLCHATAKQHPSGSHRSVLGLPGDRVTNSDLTCGLRRIEYALFLTAVLLIITGAFYEAWRLLGIGAWALIAASLIEMIHRP